VDMTRTTLWVLLPARDLCAAAVRRRSAEPEQVHGGASARAAGQTQTIAQGPVASQEAIKMLGTNAAIF